ARWAIKSERKRALPEGLSLEPEKATELKDNPKVCRWSDRKRP
ncbi:hypothetical protein A2U01_0056229, partial [Trifolium medium]|nr:hypothetical protein [Trifolium medium]